ncbi:hypothetical protein BGZ74_006368, partial [Mortierella antarctica]
ALKANSALTTLELLSNEIGYDGARVLAEVLKSNPTLTTLTLEDNSIGDNGAQALSEALKTNSTLTTLWLGSNNIGDKGAEALSEVLKTNSTLTTLDLRWNTIGDNGTQVLAETLKTNSTLTTLELSSNEIGDDRNIQTSTGQRRMPFATWLVAFDKELDHDVLLLVSATIWEQITDKLPGLMLTRVRIEAVPGHLNAWLPMRTGIAREFKAYVNAINFEWTLFHRDSLDGNIYQEAMQEVQSLVIQQCFDRFMEAVEGLIPVEVSSGLSLAQARLKAVLIEAHGKKMEEDKSNKGVYEEDKGNKGVYDYYLNQGSDIGPSAFLCAEIETMLSSSGVEGFFDAAGCGTRPVRDWWNFVVINQ